MAGKPFSERTDPAFKAGPAATVTRDPAATIGELKERSGKDIWLWARIGRI